jgi:hypothetical protein
LTFASEPGYSGDVRMPVPTIKKSLGEVQESVQKRIVFYKEVIAKHPRWRWPPPVLALAMEFQVLAMEEPLDLVRIRDFGNRLRQHIIEHRLKGFESFIWDVEALELFGRG